MADPIVAEALAVPVGAPLLTARRTYFAVDGTPLEFAISSYPGDRYQFETIISGGV
jgi:DNA-binding GntR family transcriptional regulator